MVKVGIRLEICKIYYIKYLFKTIIRLKAKFMIFKTCNNFAFNYVLFMEIIVAHINDVITGVYW